MNPVSKLTPNNRRGKTIQSNSEVPNKKKNTVKVFCRLKPLKNYEESTCIKLLSHDVLCLSTPPESRVNRKDLECKFKHIFTGFTPQTEIFDYVAYPLLEDLLKGKNGLLFTYGVTGSGKTYTLTGDQANPGIMPNCIYTIFNSISEYQAPIFFIKPNKINGFEIQSKNEVAQDERNAMQIASKVVLKKKGNKDNILFINDGKKINEIDPHSFYSVFISYVEIYNNAVYDLLDESKNIESKILREDSQRNMYVNGLVETEVKTAEEAFELFHFGQKRKKMGNTILNSVSSRSHSIFTIRVVRFQKVEESYQVLPDSEQLQVAQFSLVDLAGSERTNRTKNMGQLLRETSQINKSLLTLRICLNILRKNQFTGSNEPIPYRESKLTLLLKNYFESEGNMAVIVCVNPSVEDFEENLHVMNFAETTKSIQIVPAEPRYNTLSRTPCGTIKKKIVIPNVCKTKDVGFIWPKLPPITLFNNFEQSQTELEKLINILKTRSQKFRDSDFDFKENHFRKRLVEVQKDYIMDKSEIRSIRVQLKKEQQKCTNIETELSDLEVCNRELIGKNKQLQDEIDENVLKNEKTTKKLALQDEKMTHEIDTRFRQQREYVNPEKKVKHKKIKKAKEVLKERECLLEYNPQQTPKLQQPKDVTSISAAQRRRSRSAGDVSLKKNEKTKELVLQYEKMTHELDTELRGQKQYVNPETEDKIKKAKEVLGAELIPPNIEEREFSLEYNPQQTPKLQQPKDVTAISGAQRRRSRSAGDVWLEHNSVTPVVLGTLLQPVMKIRKSVTKLSKASDITNPKQSKYCLIAQEQDATGELETKFYKGNILPTCGGGAQVIFNDVERLKQESPGGSK